MTAYVIAAFAAALTALAFGHHRTLLEHLVSTSARILFALHTAAGLFLAYCAIVSLTHHARGYALALGACAFLELVVASLRQLAVTEANEEAATLHAELIHRDRAAYQPQRGDAVADWLRTWRNAAVTERRDHGAYNTADELLDLYRLHADTGTPLHEHACEGPHCECPAATR
ncbi:hypothetical protein ACWIG4_18145 [Streptomyces sp. NPDC002248]